MADTQTVSISLEGGCDHPSCAELANRMHTQLGVPNYSRGASVLRCPDTLEEWRAEHRTARKRADRCARLGYRFAEVDMSRYSEDRYLINTSKHERQGRPMSTGYLARTRIGPLPDYPCDRHRIHTFGVLKGERLYAYITLYRVGDLALVSMILGHGDYLRDEIMYLLFHGAVEHQAGQGGWFYYNRWDSGTEGLRFFKERLGFGPVDIDWSLA